MKTPRTNWDTSETPGVEAYRERRKKRLEGMGSEARRRGRTLRGDREGSVRPSQVYSPEEQAGQQDYEFESGNKLDKMSEENLLRAGPVRSGGAQFSTGDAARALARKRKVMTVGGRDRYRR